jgi:ubiquinone/menaquinone biosynthesis C-methylase UbiE
MPVTEGAFDVAYCQQGLLHMSDPLAALRELRRALGPAGRIGIAVWVKSPFGLFREVVASLGVAGHGPQPSNLGRDADKALEVAAATSVSVATTDASSEQAAAIRGAIASAFEPYVRDDGVHLTSVANIASACV